MPDESDVLVSLRTVSKNYRGLRPLRIEQLDLRQGQKIALLGLDQAAVGVLIDLITATTLPDTGEVRIFGRATTKVTDSDKWIALLDQFGVLSERAVLLEPLSVWQNLVMPHSLELDDPPAGVREKVDVLAKELGFNRVVLDQPVGEASKAVRARVRLGRALALDPKVLLTEHPNLLVDRHEVKALANDLAQLTSLRNVACLVMTFDRAFAYAVTNEVLTLEPSTGYLNSTRGWRRLFRR
jgi:ABC-type transporter Mla maintaining outer membrane lipid asymmetry ATPase subunit MlaF